jgi:HEAT repeat protein
MRTWHVVVALSAVFAMSNCQRRGRDVREDDVQALISQLAQAEPPMQSLGTPLLADTETTRALVRIGQPAVAPLIAALDAADPKIATYAAYCLGLIGDRAAIAPLKRARARLETKQPKGPYDFGGLSAVDQALERLGGTADE